MTTIVEEFVTPEKAQEYLGYNLHNRNLREPRVLAFARDIINDDWHQTGDTIKFSSDGVLLDGQHRLAAIAVANKGVTLYVVRGVAAASQEVMDTGAKRTFSDALKLRGETNTNNLAAVLRMIRAWKDGERGNVPVYTNSELIEELDQHPEVRELINRASAVARSCGLPPSFVTFMWWMLDRIDHDDAEGFFAALGSDMGHYNNNPITLLRRQTLSGDHSPTTYGNRRYTMATMIKVWNAYRDGAPMTLLSFRPGGAHPESFPEPR